MFIERHGGLAHRIPKFHTEILLKTFEATSKRFSKTWSPFNASPLNLEPVGSLMQLKPGESPMKKIRSPIKAL